MSIENLEELDAFLSWENSRSCKMIKRHEDYFNSIFTKEADFVEYLDADESDGDDTNPDTGVAKVLFVFCFVFVLRTNTYLLMLHRKMQRLHRK